VALVALVAGIRLLDREERPVARQGGYDILGAVTSTAAMLLLVYAIVQAPHTGWTHPLTLGAFAAVAVLLAAFVAIERRTAFPLVRLGILRSASLIRANFGVLAMFGSYIGFQFIGTLYMQSLLGWAPLQMALAFLPAGLIVGSSALLAPRLVERFGATRLVIAGFTSLTAGYLLFLRVGVDPHYATDILPSILLLGVGFALAFSPLNILATAGIANEEQGLAGGLFQTSGQLGGALVMAAVTAVVTAGGEHRDAPAATVLDSFRPGLVLVGVVALLGVLVALTGVRRRAVSVQPEPEPALATVD